MTPFEAYVALLGLWWFAWHAVPWIATATVGSRT